MAKSKFLISGIYTLNIKSKTYKYKILNKDVELFINIFKKINNLQIENKTKTNTFFNITYNDNQKEIIYLNKYYQIKRVKKNNFEDYKIKIKKPTYEDYLKQKTKVKKANKKANKINAKYVLIPQHNKYIYKIKTNDFEKFKNIYSKIINKKEFEKAKTYPSYTYFVIYYETKNNKKINKLNNYYKIKRITFKEMFKPYKERFKKHI